MATEAQERTYPDRYDDSTKESRKLKDEYTKLGYGSAILALERGRMERSWTKAGQDLRRGLKFVDEAIHKKLRTFHLRGATRLTRKQIAEVMRVAEVEMRRAAMMAMGGLRDSLDVSLRRGARAANALLESKGVNPLSRDELVIVMEESAKETARPWPPHSPSTYDKRIVKASKRHLEQLKVTLGKRYRKNRVESGIMRNVYRGLRKVGPTSLKGGSYANRLQMILVAEEARITNEVTLRMYSRRNIEFAYWRLSPSHPWYGGGEVCEWLAAIHYGGSMDALRAAGLSTIDLAGLHSMGNWPGYPHPFCKCYPEPIIL
jgi:hypothetical protein